MIFIQVQGLRQNFDGGCLTTTKIWMSYVKRNRAMWSGDSFINTYIYVSKDAWCLYFKLWHSQGTETVENLIEINISGYSEQNSRSVFNGIDDEGMVCSRGLCSYTHTNTFKMCAYVLL